MAEEVDERYHFQGFDLDLMIALGRLTLNASYLESCVATMLARLLDNDALEVGKRLTADATFRWLVDHTRAISEHRLPEGLHAGWQTGSDGPPTHTPEGTTSFTRNGQ